MKRTNYLIISIIILSSAIIAIFPVLNSSVRNNEHGPLIITNLKNGDLILRQGRSVESMAVNLLDKSSDYSHIGIVVVEKNTLYIVHVVPDKPGIVRKDLLSVYLSAANARKYKILRTDFDEAKLRQVTLNALGFFHQHLCFDSEYDLSTDTALYCTELVLKAFRQSNIVFPDIVPQKVKLLVSSYDVIMPGSFLVNSHFTAIEAK